MHRIGPVQDGLTALDRGDRAMIARLPVAQRDGLKLRRIDLGLGCE